jgi:RNA polymerase primary sigma factor
VSAFETYLSDMSRYPLLSGDEEVTLAAQYREGRAAQAQLSEASTLDPQARQALEGAIARGQQARECMIRGNLRLVVSQAKQYAGRGLSFEDLVQEGNIGLIAAVERYDPTRGNRFSTYAVWWIQQRMGRAIANKVRLVRLPVYVNDDLRRLHRARNDLAAALGRRPTPEEVAKEMGMPLKKVRRLAQWENRVLSLNAPVGDEGDSELADLVPDRETPAMEETVARHQLRERMQDMMGKRLRPREREVLRMRFGLDGSQEQTLKQVAEVLGVTRERVRQIEVRALRRLRHASVRDKGFRETWV